MIDSCRYCKVPVVPDSEGCVVEQGYPFCENCFSNPSPEERSEMLARAREEGDPIR